MSTPPTFTRPRFLRSRVPSSTVSPAPILDPAPPDRERPAVDASREGDSVDAETPGVKLKAPAWLRKGVLDALSVGPSNDVGPQGHGGSGEKGATPVPRQARAEAVGTDELKDLVPASVSRREGVEGDGATGPRSYPNSGPFGGSGVPGTLRKDIAAAKVVATLVAGMSFDPGSDAEGSKKKAILSNLLIRAHQLGRTLSERVNLSSPTAGWSLAMATESCAGLLADGIKRGRSYGEVMNTVDLLASVLEASYGDEELARAVDDLNAAKYVEVRGDDEVRVRLSLSLSAAIWDLHSHANVVEQRGAGVGLCSCVEQVVEDLASDLLPCVRSMVPQGLASPDAKVAHMQGGLRRLAQLIGSEYESQGCKAVAWVSQASGDTAQKERLRQVMERWPTLVAEAVRVGKENFIAIEQIGPALYEATSRAESLAHPRPEE